MGRLTAALFKTTTMVFSLDLVFFSLVLVILPYLMFADLCCSGYYRLRKDGWKMVIDPKKWEAAKKAAKDLKK